jgi:ParB family chromosome partitioning protein
MPEIREVKEIPLKDLVIGKGQVRLSNVGKELDELAESIRVVGLLEPIVVSPTEKPGQYEILTGQRRFLAHEKLKKETIFAVVLKDKVDPITAKIVSLTENLVRTEPSRADYIDACTALYHKYGSAKDVAEKTGLPYHKVREYVKYERLQPELKTLVDKGDVDIKVALRAQDAASVTGKYDATEAVQLAKEMTTMSGPQQSKLVQERAENPEVSVDDVIEHAKSGGKITQVIVTLSSTVHSSLKGLAKAEGTTIDDAARTLIEEGLSTKGLLQES